MRCGDKNLASAAAASVFRGCHSLFVSWKQTEARKLIVLARDSMAGWQVVAVAAPTKMTTTAAGLNLFLPKTIMIHEGRATHFSHFHPPTSFGPNAAR